MVIQRIGSVSEDVVWEAVEAVVKSDGFTAAGVDEFVDIACPKRYFLSVCPA